MWNDRIQEHESEVLVQVVLSDNGFESLHRLKLHYFWIVVLRIEVLSQTKENPVENMSDH
jgi:hypothetical protein